MVLSLAACIAAAAPSAAAGIPVEVRLERLGEPVIEAANNYSENTRVRIRLVHPEGHARAGTTVREPVEVRIEEWNTQIYDGADGASGLPLALRVRGEVEIVLKSLARYTHVDQRTMPIPQIAVSAGGDPRLLQIPQWVDADGNDKIDWLEHRVDDLLRRARASGLPELARAAALLHDWDQSYLRDCGGFDERHPRRITVAAACVDFDGLDSHRVNRGQELTATVLHELWHLYSHARTADEHGTRRWTKKPPRTVAAIPCPHGCSGPVWLADARYEDDEDDAEAFAERHKHLFP